VKIKNMLRKGVDFMLKRFAALTLIVSLISLFAVAPAQAGSKQHHMWTGAGIALGAVALGTILTHHIYVHTPPQPRVIYYPPPPPPLYRHDYVPGHWEIIREWVPGRWEKVWVPGHYDRWGNWIEGHYEERVTPGYYIEKRVWVEGYYRR